MFSLALDYFLFIFFAGLGLFQIVAAYSGLWGLLVIPRQAVAYVMGAAVLAGSYAWFTLVDDFSIPGDIGGVEGSEQFGLFPRRRRRRRPRHRRDRIDRAAGQPPRSRPGAGRRCLSPGHAARRGPRADQEEPRPMIATDEKLFEWINDLAGESAALDSVMRLLVSDFFLPVTITLAVFALWFAGRTPEERSLNQFGFLYAAIGLGFSNLVVNIFNANLDRPRPFITQQDVEVILYRPTDPSFPANATAFAFAAATGVFPGQQALGSRDRVRGRAARLRTRLWRRALPAGRPRWRAHRHRHHLGLGPGLDAHQAHHRAGPAAAALLLRCLIHRAASRGCSPGHSERPTMSL